MNKQKNERKIGEVSNKMTRGEIKQEVANLSKLAVSRDRTSRLQEVADANLEFTKQWYEQFNG